MINLLLISQFVQLLIYAILLGVLVGIIFLLRFLERRLVERRVNREFASDELSHGANDEFNRIRFERLKRENEELMRGQIVDNDETAIDEKYDSFKKFATPEERAAATNSAFKQRDGVDIYNKEKRLVKKAQKNEKYGGLPKADAKELEKIKKGN